jgi:hypothetical protein
MNRVIDSFSWQKDRSYTHFCLSGDHSQLDAFMDNFHVLCQKLKSQHWHLHRCEKRRLHMILTVCLPLWHSANAQPAEWLVSSLVCVNILCHKLSCYCLSMLSFFFRNLTSSHFLWNMQPTIAEGFQWCKWLKSSSFMMVSGTSYNEKYLLQNSVMFYCTEIGIQLLAHVTGTCKWTATFEKRRKNCTLWELSL